jgi:STE24 endopeptidase
MWLHAAVLVALTLDVVVETVADLLNARAFRAPLPATLSAWYPADAHARARSYARAHGILRAAERSAGLLLVLAAWYWQWFGHLDTAVRQLGLDAVSTGVVYVGAVLLVQQVMALPFAWYETFVVENRYGFNRTSGTTFAADLLKQLGLAVVIGAPVFAGLLAAFAYAGDAAWLWCLAVSWVAVLTMQVIAPSWLLPLFYDFRPLPDEHVRREIRRWAVQAGASLDDVHVVDGSRRSAKANAFLTGMGRHKRIALFDTLLESHPLEEVVAVVLHEIGHHKLGHIWKGTVVTLVHIAAICWLLGQAVSSRVLFDVFGVPLPSAHVGLVLFLLVYAPVSLLVSAAVNAYARRCEFEADAFVRRHMGTGVPMATALGRLSAAALEHPTPHPLFVWLHREHPPIVQRMAALMP